MKDKNESFAHHTAKTLLAKWLRESPNESFCDMDWRSNRGGPYYGVFEEYPLTHDFCVVWDEEEGTWKGEYPDYEWMKKNHKGKFKIADIAILHKGMIAYVIEIVHKNELSDEKIRFYKSLPLRPEVYAIPTHWILSQVDIPVIMPREFKVI